MKNITQHNSTPRKRKSILNTQKLIGSALAMTALAVVGMGSARANIDPIAPGTPTITSVGTNFQYTYQIEVTSQETLTTGNFFTFFDVNGLVAGSAFSNTTPGVFTASYNATGPNAVGSGTISMPLVDLASVQNVTFTYSGSNVVGQNSIGNFGFISTIGTLGPNTSGFTAVAQKTGSTTLDSNATTYQAPTPAVPEPASVVPFALGGLGLLGLIVRKTRRANGAAA